MPVVELKYYQCRLRKADGWTQVAWIPERGTKPDVWVELKEDGERWQVTEVYEGPLTEKYLREKQKADRGSLWSIK